MQWTAGIYASPDLTTTPILSTIGTQVGADLLFDFGGATLAAGTYWVGAHIVRPNAADEQAFLHVAVGETEAVV